MTARNGYDWSPLGWGCDPIPGDPDVVRATAQQYSATASSLEGASGNLRRLQFEGSSEFVTKFIESSSKLAAQLDLVRIRYEAAGTALANYAPVLSNSQATSLSALQEASSAQAVYIRQKANAQANYGRVKTATTPQEQQQWVDATTQAVTQRNAALADVLDAKRRLQAAIDERESAGNAAASQIEQAVANSPLNDSAWDKFTEYIGKPVIDGVVAAGKWVWNNIDEISLVLTIAATVLAAVPVLGQVLGVLAAVAKGLALIKMTFDVGGRLIKAAQAGDWGAFTATLVSAGAILLVAKFGGKWLAGKAAQNSQPLARRVFQFNQGSLDRFNAFRNGAVRVLSNLRDRPFVAPRPFNPSWLRPDPVLFRSQVRNLVEVGPEYLGGKLVDLVTKRTSQVRTELQVCR